MNDQPTVLICDDEVSIRHLLATELKSAGFKVLRVRSGTEAINRARGTELDVAVLDCALKNPDGIDTALQIKKANPNVDFIFLSGNISSEYRQQAIEKGLAVKHWIDKDSDWLEETVAAVLETVQESRVSLVRDVVLQWTQQNQIETDIEGLIEDLETVVFRTLPHSATTRSNMEASTNQLIDQPFPPFPEVLSRLEIWLKELGEGYKDPARRRNAWTQFRETVTEQLWAACEPLDEDKDKYRQQLADQFDRAVRKIKPTDDHRLLPEHIKAIALSLERLSSDKVDADDVHACKKAWQLARVETLPSFGKILRKWKEPYGNET